MNAIPCICIDDKNRPSEIPVEKWIKEGEVYHITHVFKMVQMNMIQGCELKERDISECIPFNCFRMDRFAIAKDSLPQMIEMIRRCNNLNEVSTIDLKQFVEQIPVKESI